MIELLIDIACVIVLLAFAFVMIMAAIYLIREMW